MPNVNGSESTSPPDGGNVVEPYKTTPLTHSNDVKETPWAKSPNNQTEFAFVPDGRNLNTHQDGGQLDPSTQMQTDTNVKDVTDRERVIREVGLTSTSFIGPVCRPEPSFEQELSEFYKELNKVDTVDGSDADSKAVKQQDLHPPLKPKSDLPNRTDSAVTVTDHGRTYRPYPDPHERNQKDPKKWRAHRPEGRGAHPEPWCPPPPPPPPWAPLHPRASFAPLMYPPDMRPQENFLRLQANNNNSWDPWRGPPFPSNRWPEHRVFPSHEHHTPSGEYQTPFAHWQQRVYEKDSFQHHNNHFLVLILLRGVPGSGKSTLARELLSTGPNGVILSTDDYFFRDNRYVFDSALLGDAHDWNQKRAEQAMLEGRSPVIIDNTNVKAWEMKPYVEMALENGYRVDFFEPDTHWKYDPAQLETRNKHGVPRETIAKMLDGFERPVNVDIVMNSLVPPHKSKGHS